MNRRSRAYAQRLHLFVLVVVVLVIGISAQVSEPDEPWHNLVALGELEDSFCKDFLYDLPRRGGRSALRVWLNKPGGGSHNRVWELRISKSDQRQKLVAGETSEALASFHVIHRNDQIFDLSNPGFWYRRTPRGYQFLVLQNWDTDTRDHGYEPGYYTWREGDVWRHSDRWGRPGEPANYFYARNSRQ